MAFTEWLGYSDTVTDETVLVEWLTARLEELRMPGVKTSEGWDLDQVLHPYPKPWDMSRAFRAYQCLLDHRHLVPDEYDVVFAVPLNQTTALDVQPPNVAECDANPWHPPLIGVLPKLRRDRGNYESYRRHIPQESFSVARGQVSAIYECSRTAAAATHNEPYDRILLFEQEV